MIAILLCLGATLPTTAQPPTDDALDVATVVARYVEARGGAERWREVDSLELTGTYAAFSERHPFTLIRQRPNRYRLDFEMLGKPAVRAADDDGPWWVHPLLGITAPMRVPEGLADYVPQLTREAFFGPLLLDHEKKGVDVTLRGRGELDGTPVIVLDVTLPDGGKETWHLDAESYLEVAIDSQVHDRTQSGEAMPQRTFFSDFRAVDGLVLPHRVETEFGARLETMEVERVRVDPTLDPNRFQLTEEPE